jgi:hypothetical protein
MSKSASSSPRVEKKQLSADDDAMTREEEVRANQQR